MKVVTCVSDDSHAGFHRFLRDSCHYYELDLVVLPHVGEWNTHRWKDLHLQAYLETLSADDIVCFTDGYDTMFQCGAAEILEKYHQFNMPVVFSAEKNCWPDKSLSTRYPESPTRFRYLNCGGFIGTAGAIRDLLHYNLSLRSKRSWLQRLIQNFAWAANIVEDDKVRHYAWSNQFYWTHVFLNNQNLCTLDYRNEIFLELSTGLNSDMMADFKSAGRDSSIYKHEVARLRDECIIQGGRVEYRETESKPCHIHFNGPVVKQVVYDGCLDDAAPWLGEGTLNANVE